MRHLIVTFADEAPYDFIPKRCRKGLLVESAYIAFIVEAGNGRNESPKRLR